VVGMKNKRNLAIGFAILVAFSLILVNHTAATDGGLNLPSTPVIIEVSSGTASFFNTTLSDVPLGYDVTNGTYLGWCIDTSTNMALSPATHEVTLYSSLNPPATLTTEKWDMVNYILNHKQGVVQDIQQAIWYFADIGGNYTPTSPVAWSIVNDALANGAGFVPSAGQITAVICFPETMLPGSHSVQISIIEVVTPVIPEFPSLAIPLVFALAMSSIGIVYRIKHPPKHVQLETLRLEF
jgi:hypothetical protein